MYKEKAGFAPAFFVSRSAHFAAYRLRYKDVQFVLFHWLRVEARFLEHLQKPTVKRVR